MSNTPLPNSDGSIWVDGAVKSGYTFQTMKDYAAAVSAAKDAEIRTLRADNTRLQNEVVMPLRERVRVLEDALAEVLAFQSAPAQPTIHDWGRWRRVLHARAALGDKNG